MLTMKKKRKRKNIHSKTFIPRWLLVPEKVGREYELGATLLELSYKYKTNIAAIRQRLEDLEIKIRQPGIHPNGIYPLQKLSPLDIQEILNMDEQNITHMSIGKKFGVSRERVRQICLQAGHHTRRERMTKSLQLKEAVQARKIVRYQKVLQISKAWCEGATPKELAILIWGEFKSHMRVQSKICQYRKDYGLKLFPRRRPGHWRLLTALQRNERLMAMSKEWKTHADIKRIKKIFGYKSLHSTIAAIISMRRRHPELFPKIKEIIKQRERHTNQTRS